MPTMSIASRPNAFAVIAICERVKRSSLLDDVRMTDVSAQSTWRIRDQRIGGILHNTYSLQQQTLGLSFRGLVCWKSNVKRTYQ